MGEATDTLQAQLAPLPFADAAAKVLELSGCPLHYRDITDQALAQNLIQTDGKTPEASLNAVISVDIKQKGFSEPFCAGAAWCIWLTDLGAGAVGCGFIGDCGRGEPSGKDSPFSVLR